MHWHPIFAQLLRPLVQDYYELRTEVPVGDRPRAADIVLLRRTAPAPFVSIWSHLTPWNVLEFKGPTDDPSLRDLDLLIEVGLGIDRRLHEERQKEGQPPLERDEVSWWYLANHVGSRMRAEAAGGLSGISEDLRSSGAHGDGPAIPAIRDSPCHAEFARPPRGRAAGTVRARASLSPSARCALP